MAEKEYTGTIRKCPQCGHQLDSLVARCPNCGLELSSTEVNKTIADFAARLMEFDRKKKEPPIHYGYYVDGLPEFKGLTVLLSLALVFGAFWLFRQHVHIVPAIIIAFVVLVLVFIGSGWDAKWLWLLLLSASGYGAFWFLRERVHIVLAIIIAIVAAVIVASVIKGIISTKVKEIMNKRNKGYFCQVAWEGADTEKQKYIENFTIPILRADFLEFFIFAMVQLNRSAVTDYDKKWNGIWMEKCRQMYTRARVAMADDPDSLAYMRQLAEEKGFGL